MTESSPTKPALLLVSEMYPPAIGGSAVLLENIYTRIENDADIAVLTDRTKCTGNETRRGNIRIVRTDIHKWCRGITTREDLGQHWAVARSIKRLSSRHGTLVHCGRAAPEALSAMVSRRLMLGPRYLCWAHGEEITTARISREYKFVMGKIYRGATAIIANSEHTGGMVASFGVPKDRIHVVHPGVDVERFNTDTDGSEVRRRFVPDPESLMLLTVGRLQPRKGQDMMIRAMGKLRDHRPRLHYVIAGSEDQAALRQLATECGVDDHVTFAGSIDHADLPRFFAACDVFAMPNRIEGADVEGFGIVFLEAAACGKPTIGGRSGGVPEAIADGQTGLLVGGTDVDELAAALDRLGSDATLRQRMGHAGRRRVVEQFTWDRAARQVLEIHRRYY